MYRSFRPTRKYWLANVIGPVLLVAALAAMALVLADDRIPQIIILSSLGVLLFLVYGFGALRTRLEIDDVGMRGRIGRSPFDYPWSDVKALRLVRGAEKKHHLLIGTETGPAQLPLEYFNVMEVWRWVQQVAPQPTLADDAFEQLSWMKAYRDVQAELLAGVAGTARVRVKGWLTGLGLFALAFFAFLGYMSWSDDGAVAILFLGFALLGALVLYLARATIEIGPEVVQLNLPIWPTHAMRWEEVQQVEIDHGLNQIALRGAGKRMVLPGQAYWRKADVKAANVAFNTHLEHRGIPLDFTARASFALPKGVRVSRSRTKL